MPYIKICHCCSIEDSWKNYNKTVIFSIQLFSLSEKPILFLELILIGFNNDLFFRMDPRKKGEKGKNAIYYDKVLALLSFINCSVLSHFFPISRFPSFFLSCSKYIYFYQLPNSDSKKPVLLEQWRCTYIFVWYTDTENILVGYVGSQGREKTPLFNKLWDDFFTTKKVASSIVLFLLSSESR